MMKTMMKAIFGAEIVKTFRYAMFQKRSIEYDKTKTWPDAIFGKHDFWCGVLVALLENIWQNFHGHVIRIKKVKYASTRLSECFFKNLLTRRRTFLDCFPATPATSPNACVHSALVGSSGLQFVSLMFLFQIFIRFHFLCQCR
jgi:hypothetical protein